jgi:hypothetical protein
MLRSKKKFSNGRGRLDSKTKYILDQIKNDFRSQPKKKIFNAIAETGFSIETKKDQVQSYRSRNLILSSKSLEEEEYIARCAYVRHILIQINDSSYTF